jgi:hypothetical protein
MKGWVEIDTYLSPIEFESDNSEGEYKQPLAYRASFFPLGFPISIGKPLFFYYKKEMKNFEYRKCNYFKNT